MRSLWRRVLPDAELHDTAFALESVLTGVVFVLGPLLVTLAIAVGSADLGLVLAAALVLAGSLVLVSAPSTAHVRSTESRGTRDWSGPMRIPALRRLLLAALLSFGALAAVDFGAIADARNHGAASAAGFLVAALSIGSIAGGLYWGSRTQPGTHKSQFIVLSAGMAASLVAVSVVPGLIEAGLIRRCVRRPCASGDPAG